MPNIYADNQEVRNFSAWGRGRLEQRVSEYGLFLQSPDLMPRARQGANRVMDHALFELAWQDGVYDQNITIQEE
jgi:hypothetical protein